MLLHSSIILFLFASTLLASVQLTPVSLFVDPCAGAAKLVNDDPAIKTDPGKASLQLSRATAVVASLEAKYNVKKSLHDAKLKNFNHAIDTLDKTEKERRSASKAVKIDNMSHSSVCATRIQTNKVSFDSVRGALSNDTFFIRIFAPLSGLTFYNDDVWSLDPGPGSGRDLAVLRLSNDNLFGPNPI
ncbi:hypothetical protein Ddc_19014 [Ditylenchus destructor]|nr:hypothetical protein Ddc_19014 [Ditylenchus destructor]